MSTCALASRGWVVELTMRGSTGSRELFSGFTSEMGHSGFLWAGLHFLKVGFKVQGCSAREILTLRNVTGQVLPAGTDPKATQKHGWSSSWAFWGLFACCLYPLESNSGTIGKQRHRERERERVLRFCTRHLSYLFTPTDSVLLAPWGGPSPQGGDHQRCKQASKSESERAKHSVGNSRLKGAVWRLADDLARYAVDWSQNRSMAMYPKPCMFNVGVPQVILELLQKQLTSPVLWTTSIEKMIKVWGGWGMGYRVCGCKTESGPVSSQDQLSRTCGSGCIRFERRRLCSTKGSRFAPRRGLYE